ncbi:DUF7882 family protein [Microbacterium gilvum]
MGTLTYGNGGGARISIDDRALSHLKVVIISKLRRQESFAVSWTHPCGSGPTGRTTIWVHPAIPLRFDFDEPEPPELNMRWIVGMTDEANQLGGVVLTPEAVAV